MNISKRYVIKNATDKPPCACAWEEHSRHNDLYTAIEVKNALERAQAQK